MTLRVYYESEEAIPEALRPHYAPGPAGGFVFQAEDLAATTAEITRLGEALAQAEEARLAAAVEAACATTQVRAEARAEVLQAARAAFADSAASPAALTEWLETRRREGPGPWWDLPAGGGIPPVRLGAAVPNPFARDTLNLTEQGRLLRTQPELARVLRDQAR
ncbi:hypothetical protein [Pararhodospirillum photometricum]|nr:hypothetical protein [Pararhodospirillum photometricum]